MNSSVEKKRKMSSPNKVGRTLRGVDKDWVLAPCAGSVRDPQHHKTNRLEGICCEYTCLERRGEAEAMKGHEVVPQILRNTDSPQERQTGKESSNGLHGIFS